MVLTCGVVLAAVVLCSGSVFAAAPAPSATPAKIVVNGRTSTAADIRIVKVGQEIPKTYAGERAKNTPGFEWYVSEHYALKSNMDDEFSRHVLAISELAYPHWVEMTGAEPPEPDTRMYIVYGSSAQEMVKAMVSDIGTGSRKGYGGGGVTMWANHSAYNYPSSTSMTHKRNLLLRENLHLLQVVAIGTMGAEGMTSPGVNHVYDEKKKRLTVSVFDKAAVNNPIGAGLAALHKEFLPIQDYLGKHWGAGGGTGAVFTQFFWTDPDRLMKWRLLRDEMYRGRFRRDPVLKVAEEICGPLEALNDEWKAWLAARHSSFRSVEPGW